MNPKFKKGFVHKGVNKSSGSNNVESWGEASAEMAKCDPCGCDPNLGFSTQVDISTTDTLFLVYVYGGALAVIEDTTANRALFEGCCRERAAGGDTPSCDSLAP